MIANAIGFEGELKYDTSAGNGQMKKTASNDKLRRLMKEKFEFTPLPVAIKESVDWFVKNQDIARL